MYKYANPHVWLGHYLDNMRGDADALRRVALALASEVEPDTIQDLFQPEMETDGYFEHEEGQVVCPGSNLMECKECEHRERRPWTPACEAVSACPACVPVEELQ